MANQDNSVILEQPIEIVDMPQTKERPNQSVEPKKPVDKIFYHIDKNRITEHHMEEAIHEFLSNTGTHRLDFSSQHCPDVTVSMIRTSLTPEEGWILEQEKNLPKENETRHLRVDAIEKDGEHFCTQIYADNTTAKNLLKMGVGVTDNHAMTTRAIGAIGRFCQIVYDRAMPVRVYNKNEKSWKIIQEGVVATNTEKKLFFMNYAQKRIELLQDLELLVNDYNSSIGYKANLVKLVAAYRAYQTSLNNLKLDAIEGYKFLSKNEKALVEEQMQEALKTAEGQIGFVNKSSNEAEVKKRFCAGTNSIFAFVQDATINALSDAEALNNNLTYELGSGTYNRGKFNNVVVEARDIVAETKIPNNVINLTHQGRIQEDEVYARAAITLYGHPSELKEQLGVCSFALGRHKLTFEKNKGSDPNEKKKGSDPNEKKKGSETNEKRKGSEKVISKLTSPDYKKPIEFNARSNPGWKFLTQSPWPRAFPSLHEKTKNKWWGKIVNPLLHLVDLVAIKGVGEVLAIGIVGGVIDGILGAAYSLTRNIASGIKYLWTSRLFFKRKNGRGLDPRQPKSLVHYLQQKFSSKKQDPDNLAAQSAALKESVGTKVGGVFGRLAKLLLYDIWVGVGKLLHRNITKPAFLKDEVKAGYLRRAKMHENEAYFDESLAFLNGQLDNLIDKEKKLKQGESKKADLPFDVYVKDIGAHAAYQALYAPNTEEFDDLGNSALRGITQMVNLFIKEIHDKHPFSGAGFTFAYALGGFAILFPKAVSFLPKAYIGFSQWLGKEMATGPMSEAIASGFLQAKVAAAVVEGIMHGKDSWAAMGYEMFQKDPGNIALYAGLAIGLGAFATDILSKAPTLLGGGIGRFLKEDTGQFAQAGQLVAGAKIGLISYEIVMREAEHGVDSSARAQAVERLKNFLSFALAKGKENSEYADPEHITYNDLNETDKKQIDEIVAKLTSSESLNMYKEHVARVKSEYAVAMKAIEPMQFLDKLANNKHLLRDLAPRAKDALRVQIEIKFPQQKEQLLSVVNQWLEKPPNNSIVDRTVQAITIPIQAIRRRIVCAWRCRKSRNKLHELAGKRDEYKHYLERFSSSPKLKELIDLTEEKIIQTQKEHLINKRMLNSAKGDFDAAMIKALARVVNLTATTVKGLSWLVSKVLINPVQAVFNILSNVGKAINFIGSGINRIGEPFTQMAMPLKWLIGKPIKLVGTSINLIGSSINWVGKKAANASGWINRKFNQGNAWLSNTYGALNALRAKTRDAEANASSVFAKISKDIAESARAKVLENTEKPTQSPHNATMAKLPKENAVEATIAKLPHTHVKEGHPPVLAVGDPPAHNEAPETQHLLQAGDETTTQVVTKEP